MAQDWAGEWEAARPEYFLAGSHETRNEETETIVIAEARKYREREAGWDGTVPSGLLSAFLPFRVSAIRIEVRDPDSWFPGFRLQSF